MASMTSFEILDCEQNTDVDSNLQTSTGDFLMFSSPVLAPDGHQNSLSSSSCTSIGSIVLDTMTTDLSERLKKLLDENIDLKDKLQKNNRIMLEQLNAMETWRDQIAQSNSKHHAVLEDLVKQNQKLQSEKEELENVVKQQHEKAEAEQSSGEAADQDQHSCPDCELLKEKCRDLEKQLECILTVKESIADELSQQQTTRGDLEESMEIISLEMSKLQSKSNVLEKEKEELVALNNALSTELSISKSEHSENVAQILKEKKQEFTVLHNEYEACEKEKDNLSTAVSVLEEELNKTSHKLQDYQEKCNNLEGQIRSNAEEQSDLRTSNAATIENFTAQIKSLEERLKEQQLENALTKACLLASEKNYQLLEGKKKISW